MTIKGVTFSRDEYLESIEIPNNINLGVMINSSQLINSIEYIKVLENLFQIMGDNSPLKLVRIATSFELLELSLLASDWLKNKGFKVDKHHKNK